MVSHFPQQQVVRGVLTTGLQFGGSLRPAEVLVTVSTGYHQEFAAINIVLLRLAGFQRVTIHFRTRIWF